MKLIKTPNRLMCVLYSAKTQQKRTRDRTNENRHIHNNRFLFVNGKLKHNFDISIWSVFTLFLRYMCFMS